MKSAEARLEKALRLEDPWCTKDVLRKLAEAADILLNEKDYDGHGWESIEHAGKAAREIIATLESDL